MRSSLASAWRDTRAHPCRARAAERWLPPCAHELGLPSSVGFPCCARRLYAEGRKDEDWRVRGRRPGGKSVPTYNQRVEWSVRTMEAAPLQGSSCPVPKMPHSGALEGSRYISHSLWTQLRDSTQCSDFSHDLCLQAREREVASLLLDQWNWELKGASVSVPCYPLQLHCIFATERIRLLRHDCTLEHATTRRIRRNQTRAGEPTVSPAGSSARAGSSSSRRAILSYAYAHHV
jgi:hypothetical protein